MPGILHPQSLSPQQMVIVTSQFTREDASQQISQCPLGKTRVTGQSHLANVPVVILAPAYYSTSLRGLRQGVQAVTAQRFTELRTQKEIIEQWLNTPGVPVDAHSKLVEMLSEVNEEMSRLATSRKRLDDTYRATRW